MSEKNVRNGLAVLIGAGSGDMGLLTLEAQKWIARAEVILYDRLANPAILDLAPAKAERIFVGKSPDHHVKTQSEINELLVHHTAAGKLVIRLKGGDSFIFGRGGEEADALVDAGCAFRVVPGITAAIAAGAYAGISLTDRRHASTLALVTGHEDPSKDETATDYNALAGIDTTVFYMGIGRLPAIASELIAAGKSPDTPAALVQNATRPNQRTVRGTLATLAEIAEQQNVKPPALIIVGEVTQMSERLGWFENQPLSGQTVLVTRSRRQASRLSALLNEHGAAVIETPTIDIQKPEDFSPLDEALQNMKRYGWLVLTSPNGVVGVMDRLLKIGLDARALAGVKIAAVGTATADVLKTYGLIADVLPEQFTTDGLAETLTAQDIAGQWILLARSDIAPEALPKLLTDAGAIVEEVTAYRTLPPKTLRPAARRGLDDKSVDWITFTSSSTVDNFFALAKPNDLDGVKIASIGSVTTKTLETYGLKPTVEAAPHTIPGLVDAILGL